MSSEGELVPMCARYVFQLGSSRFQTCKYCVFWRVYSPKKECTRHLCIPCCCNAPPVVGWKPDHPTTGHHCDEPGVSCDSQMSRNQSARAARSIGINPLLMGLLEQRIDAAVEADSEGGGMAVQCPVQ